MKCVIENTAGRFVFQAVLLALGLQHKGVDVLTKELDLPATQVLALFNKSIRKLVNVSQYGVVWVMVCSGG